MPQKNSIKEYRENSFYHIYNRGVAKQSIFVDDKDFKTFLSYLKLYLLSPILQGDSLQVAPSRVLKNHTKNVDLIAYCLMSNHFHLLIYQRNSESINYFMRSLATKYSVYFNKRYKRVGPVFSGVYKAVKVTSENQLSYLSKYIHRNPLDFLPTRRLLVGYKYSSYLNYLGKFSQAWVKPSKVLELFKSSVEYRKFVEEEDERDMYAVKDVHIDFE